VRKVKIVTPVTVGLLFFTTGSYEHLLQEGFPRQLKLHK
jgi:hypothetical protein